MDATELLTKQHRIVEQLFSQLKEASSDSREDIVTNLARNLVAHMKIEEEIFYPAAQEIDSEQVQESFSEHADAMPLLDKLMSENLSDEQFMQIAQELEDKISHHVKEEEKELFPQCRSHMDTEQLTELGEEMQSLFEDIFTGAVDLNEMESDSAVSEGDEDSTNEERVTKARKGRKTA